MGCVIREAFGRISGPSKSNFASKSHRIISALLRPEHISSSLDLAQAIPPMVLGAKVWILETKSAPGELGAESMHQRTTRMTASRPETTPKIHPPPLSFLRSTALVYRGPKDRFSGLLTYLRFVRKLGKYVFIYLYICICICVCVYVCVCVCICICIYFCTYIHIVFIFIYTHTYTYTYIHTYTYTYIHTYTYTHMYIYMCIHTWICIYIYMYIYLYMHTCMCIYIYIYIYIYIRLCIFTRGTSFRNLLGRFCQVVESRSASKSGSVLTLGRWGGDSS